MVKYIPKTKILIFSIKFCRMLFSETITFYCEMQVDIALWCWTAWVNSTEKLKTKLAMFKISSNVSALFRRPIFQISFTTSFLLFRLDTESKDKIASLWFLMAFIRRQCNVENNINKFCPLRDWAFWRDGFLWTNISSNKRFCLSQTLAISF